MARKYGRAGTVLAIAVVLLALAGCRGRQETAGTVSSARVSPTVVAARAAEQARAAADLVSDTWIDSAPTQPILFGDLHVHSRFSGDALWRSLPFVTGDGVGSPAEACDFARFCSGLDFWALTDHAETLSPAHWREAADAVRACNATAGDNADSVTYLGWEWTHASATGPQFGHRGIILRDTGPDRIPMRPISAPNHLLQALREPETFWQSLRLPIADFTHAQRYLDFSRYRAALRDVPLCPSDRDVRELPADCQEVAATPDALAARLANWGVESMVVQQGTTDGSESRSRELVLAPGKSDPLSLFEIYSGGGSAEEYRTWRSVRADGECAHPSEQYVPCCWQAGELARHTCGAIDNDACEQRVRAAREAYLAHGMNGARAQADASGWRDCGQCRDCFNPTFMYRPEGSAQYQLALGHFAAGGAGRKLRLGFIGGSDTHRGRPGTGYKETQRLRMTDTAGLRDAAWRTRLEAHRDEIFSRLWGDDPDRESSYMRTGGLVAVHAASRDRAAIWQALQRREVYATSGDRILLWFELLNGPDGRASMGSEAALGENPVFRIRAIGAPVQIPGCPDATAQAFGRDRVSAICGGECFNPSEERRVIARIDVIRIRPQQYPGEPIEALIEDPWRRFPCSGDPAGCVVELEDPEFIAAGRDTIYYVRAVQEPTAAINAGALRCSGEASCETMQPCYPDERTAGSDDCTSLNEERAWSSPIYVDVQQPAPEDEEQTQPEAQPQVNGAS